MQHRSRWGTLALALVALLVAACSEASSVSVSEPEKPAYLEPDESTGFNRVILTERAAERLDIQTAVVREEPVVRKRAVRGEIVGMPHPEDTLTMVTVDSATVDDDGLTTVVDANEAPVGPAGLWVRVNLPSSDADTLDLGKPARVLQLGGDQEDDDSAGWMAEPDARPMSRTADGPGETLYYIVDSSKLGLLPGEPVVVELEMMGNGTPRLIVPYASVIYGLNGETWVYVQVGDLTFMRQPVVIDYIEDDLAVLVDGPPADTEVATVAVAELYGIDTGVGK